MIANSRANREYCIFTFFIEFILEVFQAVSRRCDLCGPLYVQLCVLPSSSAELPGWAEV